MTSYFCGPIVLPFTLEGPADGIKRKSLEMNFSGEESPASKLKIDHSRFFRPVVVGFSFNAINSSKESCGFVPQFIPGAKEIKWNDGTKNKPIILDCETSSFDSSNTGCAVTPAGPHTKDQPKKRVHFASSTQTHVISIVTDEEVASVWWSARELAANRRFDEEMVGYHREYDDSYLQQIKLASGMAVGKLPPMERVIMALVNSPMRGMERRVMVSFRSRMSLVVSLLVQKQWAMSTSDINVKMGEDPSLNLAMYYSKVSFPAVRFAQLLATGDAQYVVDMKLADNLH